MSDSRPFTLIIDEFQNFLKINPAIFSDIQRDWDLHKRTSRLNLIISGSIFTLMTKIFEDKEEPLFGRADNKMTLEPFTNDVLKQILADFNPKYVPEDLLALDSITGGVRPDDGALFHEEVQGRGPLYRRKMVGQEGR